MTKLSRRALIKHLSLGLVTCPLLAACTTPAPPRPQSRVDDQPGAEPATTAEKPSRTQESPNPQSQPAEQVSRPAEQPEASVVCEEPDGLTANQRKVREALRYSDESPKPQQRCEKCQLYVSAKEAGKCGGCRTVPGPIHPKGWCSAFAKQ